MSTTCRVCAAPTREAFTAREMMIGLRTRHLYLECPRCLSLQIAVVPDDLDRYYDSQAYYSLQGGAVADARPSLRSWLGNRRDRAQIFDERGLFGRLARRRPSVVAERLKSFIGDSPVRSFNARILDVGCGAGALVRELTLHGFTRAEGIDPFMPESAVQLHRPPRLRRVPLSALGGEQFDVVLVTHVLEHVADPHSLMHHVRAVLAPAGICRIEVPVTDSDARRTYSEDWVELDAPRHLLVPSRHAVARLAVAAGFDIYRSEPAGSGFENWGSELYRRDIPLFERRASDAGARGDAGRERFFLRRRAS
jgi:SAM-dependent methyltransferase